MRSGFYGDSGRSVPTGG